MKPTFRHSRHAAAASFSVDAVIEQRLLIPVKSGADAGPAIAYAIRRRAEGVRVSVYLLHVEDTGEVGEAGVSWNTTLSMMRRRDQVFSAALRQLSGLDIEVSAYIRKGLVVFTILDAAEELDCQEIVIPVPPSGVLRWLSRNVVADLLASQRTIRVVAVRKDGTESLR